ncbi:hypothetical protein BS47DRAFT_1400006 [Hydnum rufescens UP504]|uniref:Uncharacterized protein n=1 Tax=Hydnum rufescens UP504 TaxID=1448309 RepID=A0A9P6AHZ2_9AGAM|nr:hypothetical protein BS47DRAFT_1400006 [Hydnum rufescens UP504]
MKRAHNGDKEALLNIKHQWAAAQGKKAKSLSPFDACLVIEWRDPHNAQANVIRKEKKLQARARHYGWDVDETLGASTSSGLASAHPSTHQAASSHHPPSRSPLRVLIPPPSTPPPPPHAPPPPHVPTPHRKSTPPPRIPTPCPCLTPPPPHELTPPPHELMPLPRELTPPPRDLTSPPHKLMPPPCELSPRVLTPPQCLDRDEEQRAHKRVDSEYYPFVSSVLWYQDKVLIIHAWGLQATLGQMITLALTLLTLLVPILILAPVLVLAPVLILAPTLILTPVLVLTPVLCNIAPTPREIAPTPRDITPTPLDIAPTPHDIAPAPHDIAPAPCDIALALNLDLILSLVLIPALAHTPHLISISLEIGLELNPLSPICMILTITGTGTIQGVPNPFHILASFNFCEALWAFDAIVQRGRGTLVPELSAHHSEGQGSSQGQGNYQQQGGPFGDRGLQGRGGPMPVHPAGQGHGSWASAVSGSAANVLVPQQQVAAQATPYDPVIIGHLLNALSGPAPNVLMPQPQAAVLGMLYSPIPVGCWFIISLGPVPEGFQTPDVWLALYPQVIAACMECKKGEVSIQLLFKRSHPRNELKVTLEGWAATHAAEVMTVMINASHAPSERYTGLRDLEYIDQYPPIVGLLIPRDQRLRRLQVVEFDTAWLVARLTQLPIQTVDLHLCQMEMMIHAHSNRVMSVGFMTMMWPTLGPVDAIIHWICRLVNEGHSTTWAPNLLPDESFGFAKSPPVWHIKLDLNLEHPKYSKPTESSAL